MESTLMFSGANSTAKARVRLTKPPFAASGLVTLQLGELIPGTAVTITAEEKTDQTSDGKATIVLPVFADTTPAAK
jgi:hypothetical protein